MVLSLHQFNRSNLLLNLFVKLQYWS